MALPASDSFTTGSTVELTVYSSNWTQLAGVLTASSAGEVYPNGANCCYPWNADSFNAAQYAEGVIGQTGTGNGYCGPGTRLGGTGTGYGYICNYSTQRLVRCNGGASQSILSSDNTNPSNGQTLRLESDSSNTHTCSRAGTTSSVPAAQTDSTYTSGSGGMVGANTGTTLTITSWTAGNLPAAGADIGWLVGSTRRSRMAHNLRR